MVFFECHRLSLRNVIQITAVPAWDKYRRAENAESKGPCGLACHELLALLDLNFGCNEERERDEKHPGGSGCFCAGSVCALDQRMQRQNRQLGSI